MVQQWVAINDAGLRVGQDHPRAKITDAEVELIRQLHAQGLGYQQIAEKFEISKWTTGRICRYEIRAQIPIRIKRIQIVPLNNFQWRERYIVNGHQGELALWD